MCHHEGFDFEAGSRSLSAVEVGLMPGNSTPAVYRQRKAGLWLCPAGLTPLAGNAGHQRPVCVGHIRPGGLSDGRGHDGTCLDGAE